MSSDPSDKDAVEYRLWSDPLCALIILLLTQSRKQEEETLLNKTTNKTTPKKQKAFPYLTRSNCKLIRARWCLTNAIDEGDLTCVGNPHPALACHHSCRVCSFSCPVPVFFFFPPSPPLLSLPFGPRLLLLLPPSYLPPPFALPLPALVWVYFSSSNRGARCDGGMVSSTLAEGHIITRW